MTKHVCKISRLYSKRLLRKLQKKCWGYFILPHPVVLFSIQMRSKQHVSFVDRPLAMTSLNWENEIFSDEQGFKNSVAI